MSSNEIEAPTMEFLDGVVIGSMVTSRSLEEAVHALQGWPASIRHREEAQILVGSNTKWDSSAHSSNNEVLIGVTRRA